VEGGNALPKCYIISMTTFFVIRFLKIGNHRQAPSFVKKTYSVIENQKENNNNHK
jgi:hypothetical protein